MNEESLQKVLDKLDDLEANVSTINDLLKEQNDILFKIYEALNNNK